MKILNGPYFGNYLIKFWNSSTFISINVMSFNIINPPLLQYKNFNGVVTLLKGWLFALISYRNLSPWFIDYSINCAIRKKMRYIVFDMPFCIYCFSANSLFQKSYISYIDLFFVNIFTFRFLLQLWFVSLCLWESLYLIATVFRIHKCISLKQLPIKTKHHLACLQRVHLGMFCYDAQLWVYAE